MADMVDVADRVSWKDLLEQRARPAGLRGVPGLCLATALETNNRFAKLTATSVYENLPRIWIAKPLCRIYSLMEIAIQVYSCLNRDWWAMDLTGRSPASHLQRSPIMSTSITEHSRPFHGVMDPHVQANDLCADILTPDHIYQSYSYTENKKRKGIHDRSWNQSWTTPILRHRRGSGNRDRDTLLCHYMTDTEIEGGVMERKTKQHNVHIHNTIKQTLFGTLDRA